MCAAFQICLLALVGTCLGCLTVGAVDLPTLKITGDWQLEVTATASANDAKPIQATLDVPPPVLITVTDEQCDRWPLFNPKAGGWAKGAKLRRLAAQECTTPHLLVPGSLQLRAGRAPNSERFLLGKDYDADLSWGTIGRLPGSRIQEKQLIFLSYQCGQLQLDSVVLTRDNKIVLRAGEPRSAAPQPPALEDGERRLANIWLPGRVAKLGPENLFPVLESVYPEPPKPMPSPAEKFIPLAFKKLRDGQFLRILAWGDSVTDGGFVPDVKRDRWQAQFLAQLQARFPQAKIELITEAWGGRNTDSYLAEPPGSLHNYKEKVLGAKPDLIVSEFVNDAGFNPAQVEQRYGKLLDDFKAIGAEWIILTPHYVRPDWMGLKQERDIDDDPRPYVKGLREFAARHDLALADASLRYGRLWRQGVPYSSLMLNSINHPDPRGMKIFADALMQLFP